MHVANKGIKYSSRCRNKGATISRRQPGCYVDVRILFPRFKTTLKTSASCALPPGVCAAHDLIEVVLVVALCAIRGLSASSSSGLTGGKSVRRAQMLLLPLFPAAYVKLVIENSDLKVVNQKSQKL